ncbi:MAG: response regulator [Gracilimonas sp.]
MEQALEQTIVLEDSREFKALIVDDMPINRSLARIFLEKNNFEIMEAENGQEALDHYNREKPDVVLMDICMPIMDGIEAMKRIRKLNKEEGVIPIIAFTSGEHDESQSELIKKGFSEYLLKPFKEKDLFDKLSKFIAFHDSPSNNNPAKGFALID